MKNKVTCPSCGETIRHWQPANLGNLGNPGNLDERTLNIMFRCCGKAWQLAADFEVRVVPIGSANS